MPPGRSLSDLRDLTPARVGLGRTGASLPTEALLEFTLDHARARDAVHAAFDVAGHHARASTISVLRAFEVASRARDRKDYLRRPDLGRKLDPASQHLLASRGGWSVPACDRRRRRPVADRRSMPTRSNWCAICIPRLAADGIEIGHAVVASGARVALGDEIGAILGARMIVMLIGERPGLSAPDSLGAYLTFAPRVGLTDAERNCVSNIHGAGLGYDEAACKIAWLVREGLAREITGVALKDESGGRTPQRIATNSSQRDKSET